MKLPFCQRFTCTIQDALDATGLSRTTIYSLIKNGRLETTKIGGRTLVKVTSLRALTTAASNDHRR